MTLPQSEQIVFPRRIIAIGLSKAASVDGLIPSTLNKRPAESIQRFARCPLVDTGRQPERTGESRMPAS